MAYSAKVQKTLAGVKMGLSVLYGADYFTEEEWINLDALIHKGKYVFTNGPPLTNIVDQQLLSFEEPNGVNEADDQKKNACSFIGEQAMQPTEDPIPPPSSNCETHAETPLETSEESSLDEETAVVPAPRSTSPMSDLSKKPPPAPLAPIEPSRKYTKEQLEEARAFLSQATKGGKKKTSSHAPVEAYASSNWTQEPQTQFSISPAPTEQEAIIASWASDVDAAEVETNSEVRSPTITAAVNNTLDAKTLAEQFIKEKHRRPKSINDYLQPNNPDYKRGRAASITSGKSARKANSKAAPIRRLSASVANKQSSIPKLNVSSGTILVAQHKSPKHSVTLLDVQAGDHIRVIKHISGTQHLGKNMRTGLTAQFCEDIFKAQFPQPDLTIKVASPETVGTALVIAEETVARERAQARRVELDKIEEQNAAEWDEVPVRRQNSTEDEVEENKERTPAQVEGFKELVSHEVNRILKLRGVPITPQRTGSTEGKADVCWFWKNHREGCRFTAEECMNAHEDLPKGTSYPLRNGKPTWGSKADVALSTTSLVSGSVSPGSRRKIYTCHFWKNGFCTKSADVCTFLHADSPAGVAKRPNGSQIQSKVWNMESWARDVETKGKKEGESGSEENGELVLEEVKDEAGSVWGEPRAEGLMGSIWGDEKYKPPHVVALENKDMQQNCGW